jgi:hypothetical protein
MYFDVTGLKGLRDMLYTPFIIIERAFQLTCQPCSVFSILSKPHQFYAAPAPGKNFDAAPAAPAPTLLYSKAKFLK